MDINITPRYALAGDATFTVSNGSDRHFTYHIYKSKPNDQFPNDAWFIEVLVGSDNSHDYAYMGKVEVNLRRPELDPFIKLTSRSRVKNDTPSYKVGSWALRAIWQVERDAYQLPVGYSIKHDGRCGRCGAKLTHPASLSTGLGPECAEQAGVVWEEANVRQPGLI